MERVAGLSCAVSTRRGERLLLLLHGWGCDNTFLHPQFHHFVDQGWTVLAPDLPGHGASAGIADVSLQGMREAVMRVLDELSVRDVIMVGHSMGGALALELSQTVRDRLRGLVMIDTVLWPGQELCQVIKSVEGRLLAGDKEGALQMSEEALFLPSDDIAVIDSFRSSFMRTSLAGLIESFQSGVVNHRPDAAASALRVPTAYIGAERSLVSTSTLMEKFNVLKTAQVLGSGHFAPLLAPEQINAMLDKFVALLEVARA